MTVDREAWNAACKAGWAGGRQSILMSARHQLYSARHHLFTNSQVSSTCAPNTNAFLSLLHYYLPCCIPSSFGLLGNCVQSAAEPLRCQVLPESLMHPNIPYRLQGKYVRGAAERVYSLLK